MIQAQDQPKLRSESEASLGFIITRLCQKRGRRKEERGEAGDRGRERETMKMNWFHCFLPMFYCGYNGIYFRSSFTVQYKFLVIFVKTSK